MSGVGLDVLNGRVEVDPDTGGLVAVRLTEPETWLIRQPAGAGLLRLAVPLPHHPGHLVEVGTHGRPVVERRGDAVRLRYDGLATPEGPVSVRVEIDLTAAADGLSLRARVHNAGPEAIPQVIFP